MSYYGYVKREDDDYVDWSKVASGISDSLKKVEEDRAKQRKELDDQYYKQQQELMNAPQGQFVDGNKFVNDSANDASQKMLINYKLLKEGEMSPREYSLRTNNISNGIKMIFNLPESYQKQAGPVMSGIQSGELQQLNAFNMSQLEGFKNFSKLKMLINDSDDVISLGIMQKNEKTGQMELTGNNMPAAVAMAHTATLIPTFKTYDFLKNAKARNGTLVETMYKAATTTGAGTITKLTGPGSIGKYKEFSGEIDNFNKAVDAMAGSALANPYNVTSVLTENVGGYSGQSFTLDRKEAEKDPGKILLKTDLQTGLNTLDPDAPNYKAQYQQAKDFIKTQFLSMLDSEKAISTTAQSTDYGPAYMNAHTAAYNAETSRKVGYAGAGLDENGNPPTDENGNPKSTTTDKTPDLFAKGAFVTIEKGKPSQQSYDDYFDATVKEGGMMTNRNDVESSFAKASRAILGQVDSKLANGVTVKSIQNTDGIDPYTSITLPSTIYKYGTINIPATENDNMKSSMRNILALIHDALATRTPITPEDISTRFESQYLFNKYNPIEEKSTTTGTQTQAAGDAILK